MSFLNCILCIRCTNTHSQAYGQSRSVSAFPPALLSPSRDPRISPRCRRAASSRTCCAARCTACPPPAAAPRPRRAAQLAPWGRPPRRPPRTAPCPRRPPPHPAWGMPRGVLAAGGGGAVFQLPCGKWSNIWPMTSMPSLQR